MKVVEILFNEANGEKLIYWKDIWFMYTLELAHRGNSNAYLQHMLLKIRKKVFGNLHIPSIMSIVFTSFKHPKLPISIKIPVTLLQIVYILGQLIANSSSWTTSLLTC